MTSLNFLLVLIVFTVLILVLILKKNAFYICIGETSRHFKCHYNEHNRSLTFKDDKNALSCHAKNSQDRLKKTLKTKTHKNDI